MFRGWRVASIREREGWFVGSEEACVGTRVRVRSGHSIESRVRDLDSVPDVGGTITRSFGHPDHAANEELLEDVGSTQLRDEPPAERRPSTMHRSAYLRRTSTCAAP